MNIEILRARLKATLDEMRSLQSDYETRDEDFSTEDQTRFDTLAASAEADRKLIEDLQERTAVIERANKAVENDGQFSINRKTDDDPYDLSELRFGTTAQELRARARVAVEKDEFLPDYAKEAALRTLQKVDRRGEVAQLMLLTGNPHYRSAFPKLVTGQHWAMTDDERAAVQRAQSTSNGSGGYAIPFTLDPTIIWTSQMLFNPMRQLATVKQITTGDWNGVSSAGTSAHWRGEAEQVDDDSIDLTQPTIPVHRMDLFTPYSIEIDMDWPQMESELRDAMAEAKDRLEATAHWTGTGTDQPTGIITALTGGSSIVTPGTAETFAIGDVYKVRRSLPARYRMSRDQPAWAGNIGTYDAIRQFDTGGGGGFWTDMNDGTPDRLLSYRTFEVSAMEDAADIAPAATDTTNRVLLFGDFRRYYVVDRIGMRVEVIPHLFGTANNRPTGERGLFAILRTGADSVDDNAFRLLNIATTA